MLTLEKIEVFDEVDYYVVIMKDRKINGTQKVTAMYISSYNAMINFVAGLCESLTRDYSIKCQIMK